jgi:hypothetical protein
MRLTLHPEPTLPALQAAGADTRNVADFGAARAKKIRAGSEPGPVVS